MSESRISQALNHIDDKLVTEAMETIPPKKAKPILRWCAIVACLAVLIGTVTVAATTDLGSQLLHVFVDKSESDPGYVESGYTLDMQIKRIPTAALTGKIQTVPAIIRQQIENYSPFSSQMPNHYLCKFPTPEDGQEFIGLDTLRLPEWDFEPVTTSLSVLGNENGEIITLSLEIFYRRDAINIQAFATVYTELWDSDTIQHSSISQQELTYTESFYTTANGLKCHIIASSPMQSGYKTFSCFLVQDGILYHLNVAHKPMDEASAEEIVHQWADQFGN